MIKSCLGLGIALFIACAVIASLQSAAPGAFAAAEFIAAVIIPLGACVLFGVLAAAWHSCRTVESLPANHPARFTPPSDAELARGWVRVRATEQRNADGTTIYERAPETFSQGGSQK
jgi:hypothetical protein